MAKRTKKQQRIDKIKKKYGDNIFHTWGLRGGNPAITPKRKR